MKSQMLRDSRVALMAAVCICAFSALRARATEYVWKNAYDKSWSDSTQWTPAGVPLAGDKATYNITGDNNVWARIGLNDQEVDTLTISGSWNGGYKRWYGDPATAKLTVGTLFVCTKTGAGVARFQAILAGPTCEVRMEDGVLEFENTGNTFAGGITINRGLLWGADGGTLGSSAQTIVLGSPDPGNDDATLQLASDSTFAHTILVRAGNDGQAIIRNDSSKSPRLSGAVTLQKPLILLNNYYNTDYRIYAYNVNSTLRMDGPIGGAGTVTKTGIGQAWLSSSANSYTGDTIVAGGWLGMSASASAVVGDFWVQHGLAMVRDNNGLGPLSNRLRLGTTGSFGALGAWPPNNGGTVVFADRDFVLEGNGGILIGHGANPYGGSGSWYQGKPSIDCVISGPGRLLIGVDNTAYLNANNTYSGGTILYSQNLDISGSGNYNKNVFGSGDVEIRGRLYLRGANNIAASAKALVSGSLSLMTDYIPTIDTNSSGTISLYGTDSGANIRSSLASTAAQLGNGRMRLAGNNRKFDGSSLQAGVDGIYRLLGESGATLTLDSPTTGCLIGANGVDALGNTVALLDANTYQGETRVWSGTLQGTAQTSGSPFGDIDGPVLVSGAFLKLAGASGGQAVKKGALTYERIAIVQVDKTASGFETELEVESLVRSNKAVLAIQGVQNDLGGNERFKVSTGAPVPDVGSGMVAPYYVDYGGFFLTYGVNGFARATPGKTSFVSANATDLVNLSLTEAPADIEVYALRTGVNVSGGNTVTLASGGLILAGGTHTAKFSFPVEGTVFCSANSTLNGAVTAPNGFIKSGGGILTLGTANGALGGTITVNQGDLQIAADNQLGSATVHLNGGRLVPTVAMTVDNSVELGARGGTLMAGASTTEYSGSMTGVGRATVAGNGANYAITISGVGNNYSGGTSLDALVTVASGSSLGAGPVYVGGRASLTVTGNANLPADQPVSLAYNYSKLYLQSTAPVCGTISGDGTVILGKNGMATTLTVGGDNQDGDYFGWIMEHTQAVVGSGKIIKVGTGTWTLWGENTYGGGTTVNQGTLVVNNWLNPAGGVTVNSGGTLDGIGTVGAVTCKAGGTVKGRLVTSGLTWEADSALHVSLNGPGTGGSDVVTVNGAVNLNGCDLSIDLNYKPAMGAEITIVANDGTDPVSGQFSTETINILYEGMIYRFELVYDGGDGNDVVLKRVPVGTMILVR